MTQAYWLISVVVGRSSVLLPVPGSDFFSDGAFPDGEQNVNRESVYNHVKVDYAAIERRLLAHTGGLDTLVDRHIETAAEIFGVSESEVTPTMRRKGKEINYHVSYGISKGIRVMSSETESDTPARPPATPVDTVIDLLGKRVVSAPDRGRLGEALERANAPQKGRAGADEGLGRALGGGRR